MATLSLGARMVHSTPASLLHETSSKPNSLAAGKAKYLLKVLGGLLPPDVGDLLKGLSHYFLGIASETNSINGD